jgi:hypothetical protein
LDKVEISIFRPEGVFILLGHLSTFVSLNFGYIEFKDCLVSYMLGLFLDILPPKLLFHHRKLVHYFSVQKLRAAIAATYYADLGIEETDIFVSDGAKCDISRLQVQNRPSLFPPSSLLFTLHCH